MIKEKREKLYKNVMEKKKSGLKPMEIAKLYDISRQHVYQIFWKEKKGSNKFDK